MTCSTDEDCKCVGRTNEECKSGNWTQRQEDPVGVCIKHMWAHNGQHDSGKGCWDVALCVNYRQPKTSSYTLMEGRKIQWFCTDEQKAKKLEKNRSLETTYKGLIGVNYDHWKTYKESCSDNKHCKGKKQKCTKVYWETKKGQKNSFS